jgi:hypothetical protein
MIQPRLVQPPTQRFQHLYLRLLLIALEVLVGEEGEGAADEDKGVDADAETGCFAAGFGSGGGGCCGGFWCWVAGLKTRSLAERHYSTFEV